MPRKDINQKWYLSYLSYSGESPEEAKARIIAKRKKFRLTLSRKRSKS